MFKAVPMLQLTVVVLERDTRVVLRALGESGAVQLRRTPAGPESAPTAAPEHKAEFTRCERLAVRVAELRGSLGIAGPTEDLTRTSELSFAQAEAHFGLIEKQASTLLKRHQQLLERGTQLSAVCEQLSSYRGLDLPLDGTDRYAFLHFVTGSLPAENLAQLQKQVGSKTALLPLETREDRRALLAMTTRAGWHTLEDALERAGFTPEPLPTVEGASVDTLTQTSLREQASVTTELQQAKEQLRSFAVKIRPSLAAIEQAANLERRLLEADRNFPRTDQAVLLAGWIPIDEAARLEQRLRTVTGGRCIIKTAPPERMQEIPVLLRHPRLLRPFQMLVAAYGVPRYDEVEPTLFVAISYLLMFGMMFGDVGHGFVLVAGGLLALLAGRGQRLRDLGLLLLLGGLSSIVFGAVYGSYFGLPQLKQYALWQDPLEGDPMGLMSRAVQIGVVMISLGLVLNIINRFRRGDVIGGFLDKFGVVGVVFYWGMLTLLLQHSALQARGLVSLALGVFLVLPIIGWSLKEPLEYLHRGPEVQSSEASSSFGAALTESLVGAFEAVLSYLSNTISFVRLAAYAMSHAALLVAAFMMAAEIKHIPSGGGILSVLVIIAGNLVAVILEGIVASVQALRLEYYEFFGKFFAGTGQPFKPFHLPSYDRA